MKRLASLCGVALVSAAAWAPLPSHAAVEVLNEGFNNVSGLSGWTQVNRSVPPGNAWFQGNPGIFGAQNGAANSYAAVNYLSASNGMGSVDNWLITPTLALGGLTTLSFYVNSAGSTDFSDLLEVRFASGSSGTGLEAFDTLLLTIGGEADFPNQWTQFTATFMAAGDGRFAFRYLGDAANLEYVGLDSVQVITAVPEPSTYLMLLAGLGGLGAVSRRYRKQA
jgi:hypothetical protein